MPRRCTSPAKTRRCGRGESCSPAIRSRRRQCAHERDEKGGRGGGKTRREPLFRCQKGPAFRAILHGRQRLALSFYLLAKTKLLQATTHSNHAIPYNSFL